MSYARPAILGAQVYFGTEGGRVVARDVQSGTPTWNTQVSTEAVDGARLVAINGVVVAPTVHSTVGLDATSGAVLWHYEAPPDTAAARVTGILAAGQLVDSRIDADDQMVYIPAWGASVSALDLKTGAVQWIWQPGRSATDTAASGVFRSGSMGVRVSGDTVFAVAWHYLARLGVPAEAWVVALDRGTGRELWRVTLPKLGAAVFIEAAPALSGNLVIVNTDNADTYAIDRTTQKIVWTFSTTPTGGPASKLSTVSGPEAYGDAVYVDGGDSHIYALRATDGSVIWSAPFQGQATRDLLVTERRVIFTNGGTIIVLDRQTGHQVASVDQPNTNDPLIASPAIFANGLVCVTVADADWCFNEP